MPAAIAIPSKPSDRHVDPSACHRDYELIDELFRVVEGISEAHREPSACILVAKAAQGSPRRYRPYVAHARLHSRADEWFVQSERSRLMSGRSFVRASDVHTSLTRSHSTFLRA